MAFKDLPVFYYHTHFMEFLDFVKGPSAPLLNTSHRAFLNTFDNLEHAQQCLLVRLVNRKYPLIKRTTLRFEELEDIPKLLSDLTELKLICDVPSISQQADLSDDKLQALTSQLLSLMTKPELYALYQQCAKEDSPVLPKSAAKGVFVEHCLRLSDQEILLSEPAQAYVYRQTDDYIDYFLFLYFGHRHGALNQFSMRDLGIMRTREQQAQMQQRFADYDNAYSTYTLQKTLHDIKQMSLNNEKQIKALLDGLPQAHGIQAQEYEDRIRFVLAKALLEYAPKTALSFLFEIQSPKAQEFWCRQAFKLGLKNEVEDKLNQIIDSPLSDHLLQFAEDFLARKYKKKRTSILTDMLRENTRHLLIDETYKGSVERGVIAYYQARGVRAWRTENRLWQNLFGLCFWPELFEIDRWGLATPFDYIPLSLKQNCLLDIASEQVNHRLDKLNSNKDLVLLLTKHCTKYFGQSQGIVAWHNNMLESLLVLAENTPLASIKQHLRIMCGNWALYNDGYPDIMVLENGNLRFEEIKAKGDSLRRNQLIQIQGLKQCGLDVGITTVDWTLDPMQPYAVIDIETTGGRAGTHKITEIGMVKMINGEVVDQWQSLINPERRIPAMITDLTGINNDMVADAPLFVDLADDIERFTENCIFVAHNVNFDYGFIREEFARINRTYRRPKLCTVQQMRQHYKGLKSYSLANLTRHFDIKMERHHRALSDAIAASELLKLVNQARTQTTTNNIKEPANANT
jgi:DNA polymerase-3 subunit epsilon